MIEKEKKTEEQSGAQESSQCSVGTESSKAVHQAPAFIQILLTAHNVLVTALEMN